MRQTGLWCVLKKCIW
jgi:SusD family.